MFPAEAQTGSWVLQLKYVWLSTTTASRSQHSEARASSSFPVCLVQSCAWLLTKVLATCWPTSSNKNPRVMLDAQQTLCLMGLISQITEWLGLQGSSGYHLVQPTLLSPYWSRKGFPCTLWSRAFAGWGEGTGPSTQKLVASPACLAFTFTKPGSDFCGRSLKKKFKKKCVWEEERVAVFSFCLYKLWGRCMKLVPSLSHAHHAQVILNQDWVYFRDRSKTCHRVWMDASFWMDEAVPLDVDN